MEKEFIFSYKEKIFHVEVIRSSRKSIGLEIKDGKIKARIPYRMTDTEANAFIIRHEEWLYKKTAEIEKRKMKPEKERAINQTPILTKEEEQKMLQLFSERIRYFAAIMGITYGKVTIRNQKTRWGSCSSKGNLNFNYRLYFMPQEIMDYVIIHELAHRRHMDHSKAFWEEVERYDPLYKEHRKRLKES